jgi:glyoxylase-like metal-dependent hydrolase (beta-lactamase superfamily II)
VSGLVEVAAGVLVVTSEFALTTTTVLADGDGGCLVVDPGVTVAELTSLAAALGRSGLRPRAGWSTHPHWDHVLWCRELGDVPRYAAPAAVAAARAWRAGMLRQARRAAPGHDPRQFGRLTPLPAGADAVPWDGPQARAVLHDGHAPGHGALFLPGTGTLIAGDMLSDAEIPLLDLDSPDPLVGYRAGLHRLAALDGVRRVIPGHGHPGDAAEFHRRLALDLSYLDALERGTPVADPRLTQRWLRTAHGRQVRHATARGAPARRSRRAVLWPVGPTTIAASTGPPPRAACQLPGPPRGPADWPGRGSF